MGWSLGGMLALEVCAAGFRPRALITIAACASFCRRPDFGLGVPPAVVRGMRQRLKTEPSEVVQDFYRQLLAPGESEWEDYFTDSAAARLRAAVVGAGFGVFAHPRPAGGAGDGRGRVSDDRAWGKRSNYPAAQAYFLKEQLPGARLVMLPGAGHVPMVSRSREINELIADFL